MHIRITFLGAAGNVTGSCYLIEVNNNRILVDCGLYQERELRTRNWKPFPFDPESIKAVFLTHAHLDHCGLLPKLVRDGFRGNIYCTDATAEITKIMLFDAARIQEEDAEFKKKRHERERRRGPYPEIPLYTTLDAQACFPLLTPVRYTDQIEIDDGISASFHDAGHVLGSSMIMMELRCDNFARKLIFSGDVGRWERPILNDPTLFDTADYVVVESTYGDRLHEDTSAMASKLADVINSTVKAGGNVLIPSFAFERAQEVLYYIGQLIREGKIPRLMVFVDSPMAAGITEVFKHHSELFDDEMKQLIRKNISPFDLPGLRIVKTIEESKSINSNIGAVIIAGSGMCTGGRIKHHLATNISRAESTILFVGYQAIGTLGRQIIDGAPEVRILGQMHRVRANIIQLTGFSAHADRDDLFRWLSAFRTPPRHVFVVHGESNASQAFAEFIKEKTHWDVSIPRYLDAASLD